MKGWLFPPASPLTAQFCLFLNLEKITGTSWWSSIALILWFHTWWPPFPIPDTKMTDSIQSTTSKHFALTDLTNLFCSAPITAASKLQFPTSEGTWYTFSRLSMYLNTSPSIFLYYMSGMITKRFCKSLYLIDGSWILIPTSAFNCLP